MVKNTYGYDNVAGPNGTDHARIGQITAQKTRGLRAVAAVCLLDVALISINTDIAGSMP